MRNKILLLILGAAMMASGALYAQEPAEDRATFRAVKGYEDSNPDPVDVTLICNTGLPLEQTFELDPLPSNAQSLDPHVEFVVTDFESGTLDCEITEGVPTGYSVIYRAYIDGQFVDSDDSCVFENVEHGETFSTDPVHNLCAVGNFLNLSEVTVTKEWIDDTDFNASTFAQADYTCTNLPDLVDPPEAASLGNIFPAPATRGEGNGVNNPESGHLTFFTDPDDAVFTTFGNWDGGTKCSVTEQTIEGGVETDSSDCDEIVLGPGDSGACTIVNTRLFAGIPTLSQYGLGLLALLMLGMGFVAFRRIA